MMNKIVSLISLSKRAGFLVNGLDSVIEAVYAGGEGIVILANDLSKNTEKKIVNISEEVGARVIKISLDKEDVFDLVKKYSGVLYVSDKGLADKIYQTNETTNGGTI